MKNMVTVIVKFSINFFEWEAGNVFVISFELLDESLRWETRWYPLPEDLAIIHHAKIWIAWGNTFLLTLRRFYERSRCLCLSQRWRLVEHWLQILLTFSLASSWYCLVFRRCLRVRLLVTYLTESSLIVISHYIHYLKVKKNSKINYAFENSSNLSLKI